MPSPPVRLLLALLLGLAQTFLAADALSRYPKDVLDDTTQRLFPVQRLPLATEDTWISLRRYVRDSWSFANDYLRQQATHAQSDLDLPGPFPSARATLGVSRPPIRVPVRVVLVDTYKLTDGATPLVAQTTREMLLLAQRAMRATTPAGDVAAIFKLELAPPQLARSLFDAITRRYAVTADDMEAQQSADAAHRIRRALEREYAETARWAGGNLLFVLINVPTGKEVHSAPHGIVRAAAGRMSWVMCHDARRLIDVLVVAETAARDMYLPAPAYNPIPFSARLRLHVHPYTPEYENRALWFDSFDWPAFEAEVRALAPHAQAIGFFATQTNRDCLRCADAFAKYELLFSDRCTRAATFLNSNVVPNASWAGKAAVSDSRESWQRLPPGKPLWADGAESSEFNLFVIDTARLANRTDAIRRVETMAPCMFPGMGVIALRSSLEGSKLRLRRQLVAAIAHGAFGVKNPFNYMTRDGNDNSASEESSCQVMRDVIGRNLVSSLIAQHASAAEDLLTHLAIVEESGLSLPKVLDREAYTDLSQRLNLLLYKLDRARHSLSQDNDVRAAIHFGLSAAHDVRAIGGVLRLALLGEHDPSVRCHFSAVKRSALRAGKLLLSGGFGITDSKGGRAEGNNGGRVRGSGIIRGLVACAAYVAGIAATRFGVWYFRDRKELGKIL
jgi:hypothetical protein